MRSPCTDAAIAELRAAGVYDYELVRGGKHWQVQWALKDGARRFYVLPGTRRRIGDQRVTCELISAGC